jgi:hypothetical protein
MEAPVIVVGGSTILSKHVLFHPIYLEIPKGDAVPHADDREAMPRSKNARKEAFHVFTPEGRHTWVG